MHLDLSYPSTLESRTTPESCKDGVKRWRRRESADGGRGERKNELPLDVSGFRHNTDPLLTPLLKHGVPPGTPAHGTPEHSGTPLKILRKAQNMLPLKKNQIYHVRMRFSKLHPLIAYKII